MYHQQVCWGRIDAMDTVIGPPGEAVEELYSPYHCCAGRAGGVLSVSCKCSKNRPTHKKK